MMNPLFNQTTGGPQGNQQAESVRALMRMLRGNDPKSVTQLMAQKNPQFAAFMKACQGKTPEQIASEYGVDLTQFKDIL